MVKVHRIIVPSRSRNLEFTFRLVLGISAAFVASYLLALLILCLMFKDPKRDAAGWVYGIAALIGGAGSAGWVVWRHHRNYEKAFGSTPLRTKRLSRIASDPRTPTRLPHRIVEHAYRSRFRTAKKVARAFHRVPSMQMIVVWEPADGVCPLPIPTLMSFEPIEVLDPLESEDGYVFFDGELNESDEHDGISEPAGFFRPLGGLLCFQAKRFGVLALLLVGIGSGVYGLYDSVRAGKMIGPSIIIAALIMAFIAPLFFDNRWFFAPAALIVLEARFWTRTPRVRVFTPDSTPMMIAPQGNEVAVIDGRRVRGITCSDRAVWAIMACWISLSEPPTQASAHLLLTGEGP